MFATQSYIFRSLNVTSWVSMGLCVSTSWCLVRHRLKGLAVKVVPASVFRCCFGSFCPLFTFIFFRWSTSTMELKAGDWFGCFRIFHFLTLKKSLFIFTVCFGLVSTYSLRHFSLSFACVAEFELFPSSVTSSIITDTAPLHAVHNSAPSVHRWSCMDQIVTFLQTLSLCNSVAG